MMSVLMMQHAAVASDAEQMSTRCALMVCGLVIMTLGLAEQLLHKIEAPN
jgi:hypothetical protein